MSSLFSVPIKLIHRKLATVASVTFESRIHVCVARVARVARVAHARMRGTYNFLPLHVHRLVAPRAINPPTAPHRTTNTNLQIPAVACRRYTGFEHHLDAVQRCRQRPAEPVSELTVQQAEWQAVRDVLKTKTKLIPQRSLPGLLLRLRLRV